MDGEALYERYKDALKRGHIASLRGRLEDALAAYADAAAIAPERSTPHTSAGTALLRHELPGEALRHFTSALRLTAGDDAALLGRAQALASLGRRPEAADAFDTLAESRAAAGRLADAVDAARRGLELAEGRDRRRTLERLIARLRASEPGETGRSALELALLVLDGRALAPGTPDQWAPAAGRHRSTPVVPQADHGAAAQAADAGPLAAAPDDAEAAAVVAADVEPAGELAPAFTYRRALDRGLEPDIDAGALAILAQAAGDANDPARALERLLDLAAAYRRDGHIDAALDACYLALSLDPDDIGLHLALVELYDERGWTALATEKLDLVAALADLDGGAPTAERVAAARNHRA